MKNQLLLIISILMSSELTFGQETILKIGFEKSDTTRWYKYFENDIEPMSQTANDKSLGNMGLYYCDSTSKYLNRGKYLSAVDFYGGIAKDPLIKYESARGKVYLVMDLVKLINFEDTKMYGNGMVYYKLPQKLKKGSRYHCSLDYVVNNKSSNINVNGFGFMFVTNTSKLLNTYKYLLNEPQVYNKEFLNIDGTSWHKLEGDFIADKDYETMIVGFFEPRNIFKLKETSVMENESLEFNQIQTLRIRVDDIEIRMME